MQKTKVRAFIDGPLSEFASKATTMIKDFVFGKGKEGEEGASDEGEVSTDDGETPAEDSE